MGQFSLGQYALKIDGPIFANRIIYRIFTARLVQSSRHEIWRHFHFVWILPPRMFAEGAKMGAKKKDI